MDIFDTMISWEPSYREKEAKRTEMASKGKDSQTNLDIQIEPELKNLPGK